jgi:hypothetical protein
MHVGAEYYSNPHHKSSSSGESLIAPPIPPFRQAAQQLQCQSEEKGRRGLLVCMEADRDNILRFEGVGDPRRH